MSDNFETMAETLDGNVDYRVLRRLVPRHCGNAADADTTATGREGGDTEPTSCGVFIDCETTGLDPRRDEVIQLAMVRFSYTVAGRIAAIGVTFDRLRQPSCAIPPLISKLTGITDDMVAGRVIDADEVTRFVAPADIVIAHNARFDRHFVERLHPAFITKSWACSMSQVPWADHGHEGVKLCYLLMRAGLFHDGHRALDDCHAALELLARPLGDSGRSALGHLLDEARRTRCRLRAAGAPYVHKDWLRSRGYRWGNGEDGQIRAWFIDLDEGAVDAEVNALRAAVFDRHWQPQLTPVTALNRFSDRV